jgi:hypothetical protein
MVRSFGCSPENGWLGRQDSTIEFQPEAESKT